MSILRQESYQCWWKPQHFVLLVLLSPALCQMVSCRHHAVVDDKITLKHVQRARFTEPFVNNDKVYSSLPLQEISDASRYSPRDSLAQNNCSKLYATNKPNFTTNNGQTCETNNVLSSSSASARMLSIRGGAGGAAASAEFSKRLFVSAVVTLMYEGVIGHLLEFLKIVMQTSPPGTTYLEVLRRITADKGIAGVWDGFLPWGVVQAVLKGGIFGLAYSMALSVLMPLSENGHIPKQLALTLAGGIAGGIQGYVLSPTLLLKTRVMTNDIFRESMSLWRTTVLSFRLGWDVIQTEGVGALMKGSNVFAFKRVCDWSSRYYFSDLFGKMLLNHAGTPTLTPSEKIAADLLGGTASTLVTLPLDVIVAKIQDAKKAGAKVSPLKLFKDELEEGGWKGLSQNYLQGFEARLLHVCFTTVAMKTGTAFFYDFLFGAAPKKATT